MAAIRTEGLTKYYPVGFWRPRPRLALDALSLEVERGEVFGFLGPNGAGKSTTLKLLMGLVFPSAGRAEILDRPVGDLDVRRRIGFLPENPYFYDNLTAEEVLTYFAALFGYSPAERRQRVTRVLDALGIGAERRLQLRRFSKGMVQRVGLAQALLNDPEVVFLDEPMSGLDPIGRRDVRELILQLRNRGSTVFFSSHVLSDAEALCHRVAIIARGRLVAQGSLAEMVDFQVRGWELVVSDLSETVMDRVRAVATTVTRLGGNRHELKLPPDVSPDRFMSELAVTGATLVSINPVRQTLEDVFLDRVAETAAPRAAERVS
jgi:ABC-2 type transport system ATP-binding protein